MANWQSEPIVHYSQISELMISSPGPRCRLHFQSFLQVQECGGLTDCLPLSRQRTAGHGRSICVWLAAAGFTRGKFLWPTGRAGALWCEQRPNFVILTVFFVRARPIFVIRLECLLFSLSVEGADVGGLSFGTQLPQSKQAHTLICVSSGNLPQAASLSR